MNAGRIWYRTRQFWQALGAELLPADLELARTILTPAQLALFGRMQPSEQAHSLRVLRSLLDRHETQPDLLAAALLHDVGKSRFSLHLWERVLIVLGRAACPARVKRWGAGLPDSQGAGWRRAFVMAEQHPQWGARLAAQAGSSALAVELIRRHQEAPSALVNRLTGSVNDLLSKLQAVDAES